MDQGTMAGLAGALGAAGTGIGDIAQDQFKEQIDAANRAQKDSLQKQQQAFEMDKTKYTVGHEDQRAKDTLDQQKNFHADTVANEKANTDLRASEVASGNERRAVENSDDTQLLPYKKADLKSKSEGLQNTIIDNGGVPKAAMAAAVKEQEQANSAVKDAQEAYDKASANTYTTQGKKTFAEKTDALKQARERAAKATSTMERLSGLGKELAPDTSATPAASGVAPKANPKVSTPKVDVSAIPPAAIGALKSNPALRVQFDQKYGVGASDQVLGN